MSGIVGILDHRVTNGDQVISQLIIEMLAAGDTSGAHGADPSGTSRAWAWSDPDAGVGLGSDQRDPVGDAGTPRGPVASRCGRYMLVLDGELYDRTVLARQLGTMGSDGTPNGVSPNGVSPNGVPTGGWTNAELLVETIATRGVDDALRHVDGSFTFALWDRNERALTLGRDRMGTRPLHYGALSDGTIVFGSSLDSLAAHPGFVPRLDPEALTLFFRYKYVPSPWSIYRGIRKLETASTVRLTGGGQIGRPRSYWSYFDLLGGADGLVLTPEDIVTELDRLLRLSVRRRLDAGGRVGSFLSGGIDSTTIAAIAQSESPTPIDTFTIGSPDVTFDESRDARRISRHLGTNHHELVVTDAEVLSTVERLGRVYDEPFADSSQVPTLLVSELARRQVDAALGGDAGDELFAGYNRYLWVPAIWRRLGKVPVSLRSPAARLAERVPPSMWDRVSRVIPESRRPRMLGLKVAKVLGVADAGSPHEIFNRLVSHWQEPERLVIGGTEPLTMHTDPSQWPRTGDIVEHMAAIDVLTYLPDDGLVKGNRAGAAAQLTTRFPMLDQQIVEFSARVPMSVKIEDGQGKRPLRGVLARYVPSDLFERPKAGFGLPIEEWLRGPLRPFAAHHLFDTGLDDVLDRAMIERRWNDHQSGRSNEAYHLWDVIMFSAWREHRGLDS